MNHALIVDDDADAADMLAELVATEGFTVTTANSLEAARRQLALQRPDVVLLDLVLPDGSGMQLFDDPRSVADSEVVLITGHASLETSVQALRLGAADYLIKPINIKQLRGVLSRVMRPTQLQAELKDLRAEFERTGRFGLLWGRSKPMQLIYEQVARVAATAVTVFLTGESGSGKEVVAQTVHQLSRRRKQPFLAVNCGAISPHLIESEIFGHEKGSFTGALRQHQGFFERAHGGTLFLDEVTEMPLDLQVKLLRVLETGTFMRIGSTDVLEADVRIIAATNRVPEDAVASGKLREDVLYRLNVFPIHVPPLRDRPEDIDLLASNFLGEICQREGKRHSFTPAALQRMTQYNWPGNVRELRNAVHRAFVMTEREAITEEWLPLPSATRNRNEAAKMTIHVGMSLEEVERMLIFATLEQHRGHKEKTAAMLGISLKTLYNRLKEYAQEAARQGGDNRHSSIERDRESVVEARGITGNREAAIST